MRDQPPTSEKSTPPGMRQIREYFASLASHYSAGPIAELVAILADGGFDAAIIDAHIKRHGVAREDWYHRQVTDLGIGFIDHCLRRGGLDRQALANVHLLNSCLGLESGAYFRFRPAEVAARLATQMDRILEDAVITDEEELYQVELQAAFALGYDEYLSLVRGAVERAYAGLQEAAHLGSTDSRRASQNLVRLEPLYRLVTARPRRSGALY